ncbi:DNA-directed RNA polymerase sigma-70 factor [Clostridia bacterium]|nr:DNA-directed RNA polymerase sigma-70 factor [Clostridia bacterium]
MHPESLCTGERVQQAMDAHGAMIYRLAYARTLNHADAEDVLQEVMLRLVQRDTAFDSAQHEKFWLLRVTGNLSLHVVQSAWRRYTVGGALIPAAQASECPAQNEALQEAMATVGQKYRAPIHLFYYEDLSVEEIARILGRRPSTVRSQLTRGREQLRRLLTEGGQEAWT